MPDPQEKPKGSPMAQLSALLGFPGAGGVPWAETWRLHNPENIRPRPDNPRSGRGDVRVFAKYGPGFEHADPGTGAVDYPGHMGLEFALLNSFRQDTLSGLFGEPEGGVTVYPNLGLDQVLTKEDRSGQKWAEPFSYRGRAGRPGLPGYKPDEIRIQQGTTNERRFQEGLTHEYVHRAQARGLPRVEEDQDQLDLTRRLINMSAQFGHEPMANAISRAMTAVRTIPEESRAFHRESTAVQHTSDPEDYQYPPAAADSAVAWLYSLLGRE